MRRRLQLTALVVVVAVLGIVAAAVATGGGKKIDERLSGYEETPLPISTTGSGKFDAQISRFHDRIDYRLSYRDLEGDVQQAHIHFGHEKGAAGGISVFLCTNLGNGPAGTQACPAAPATITGTIRPGDVIGPGVQGIEAGAYQEFLDAIDAGVTYVNVHSTKWPGGEIRAQIDDRRGGR
ncbi:MAG TPA: CHRD domain-containing protein [Solirubrobacteraceae bacterium]|nr:CHRD domain-containing protein [Solirubrobacteraceae bacterium]